ncbi:MAG: hypothetical protein WCC01_02010 [Acidimicrobiia bacterium]
MDEQRRIEELEQALRDERIERDAAQRRIGELQERADLWRSRAEERTERIDRLVAERDFLREKSTRFRFKAPWPADRQPEAAPAPVMTEVPTASESVARPIPSMPAVRIAGLAVDHHVSRVLKETDVQSVDEHSLVEADAVVVELRALATVDMTVVDAIEAWANLDARQPLVVIGDTDSPLGAVADVVIPPEEIITFDPDRHNPMRDRRRDAAGEDTLDAVAAAASGTPLLEEGAEVPETEDGRDRLAVHARRWAYRRRAPWVMAHRLLDRAGVPHTPPVQRVAGLLVSMRPDDVVLAAQRFAAQTYGAKELVVVCHGFDTGAVTAALGSGEMPFQVIGVSKDHPLGTCLNVAAEATSADVLAKIDDDDHYGPGFLVDAVDALHYSHAEIVGKAAHYTYVQGSDVTVLRRPDDEERFVDGAVAGGSMVFQRRVWEDVRFPIKPRRVDALFLRGGRTLGARVFANTRWDFVYTRRAADQTWRADDDVFLANTFPAWDGDHPERADA